MILLRILCLCLLVAGLETINGIVRSTLLAPRIGDARARRVSLLTGLALASLGCFHGIPWLRIEAAGLFLVGAVLAGFMASFDIVIARLVVGQPWSAIARDFDPRRGNLISVGLVALVFIPWLVTKARVAWGG